MTGLRTLALPLTAGLTLALLAGPAGAQWSGWGTSQSQSQPQQGQGQGQAQTPPGQPSSRGENFSANKAPAQLFASDCTGAGCHKGPQGLSKDRGQGSLASFLREHYTNSRESASALAGYLVSIPADPRARPDGKPARAARGEDAKPGEARKPAAAAAPATPTEGGDAAKPAAAKPPQQRGRAQTTASTPPAASPSAATTSAAPEAPAPAPAPAAPPEPPKPQWDIFD